MKLILILVMSLTCTGIANAQKTEVAVQLNTSAAKFGGNSAVSSTFISVSDTSPDKYLGDAYGSKTGIGYGLGLQLQRVTSYNMLLGVQVAGEQLRSSVEIDRIVGFRQTMDAEGDATLKLNAVNVQPYFGLRLTTNFVDLDITAGLDAGYIYKSKHNGEATDTNGNTYKVFWRRNEKELDFRPRVGITGYRAHFGVSVSYAHGLTNYRGGWDGGNPELYSRVFRLGVLYRL